MTLPPDLCEFYLLAGGMVLFSNSDNGGVVRILAPENVERIDVAIYGEPLAAGPFCWWYAIADVEDGNYIAIDLNPEHQGLCYDAFHETIQAPGYINIIANSFTDLLRRLLKHKEDWSYWIQDGFEPLGEAFLRYGYPPLDADW
jgi:hypothetical protein